MNIITLSASPRIGYPIVALALIWGGISPQAYASVTFVNSLGFESPAFAAGPLAGQPGVPFQNWLHAGAGTSTANVETAVVDSGTQAVQVNRAANSNDRWAVPVTGQPIGLLVTIDWDMRVEHTAGAGGTFGPFFGVDAYDSSGGPALLLGSLGVDASTGDVLYQAAGTGFLTETGTLVSFGQWNHFQLLFDYGTHKYSFSLNSVPLFGSAQGFVDGALNAFTDGDIAAFAAAGDPASLALTGTAYFDNFVIQDVNATPEPATWLLVGVGLAFVLRRGPFRRSI